jgi:hypothetical protein
MCANQGLPASAVSSRVLLIIPMARSPGASLRGSAPIATAALVDMIELAKDRFCDTT